MADAPPHIDRLVDVHGLGHGSMATAHVAVRSIRHAHDRNGAGYYDLVVSDASAKLPGKIWGDARAYGEISRAGLGADFEGEIVKLLFTVGSYRDTIQLTVMRIRVLDEGEAVDRDVIFGEGWELVAGLRCRTLVFDIETVPAIDPLAVPESVARAISRAAERHDGDRDKVMGLSPYYGKVVSLAFGEGETRAGEDENNAGDAEPTVFVVPPDASGGEPTASAPRLPSSMRAMSEVELLRAFWHLADAAELVVTFNGRGFDVPFLVTRSLILGVPARVDLLSSPFSLRPHLDLYRLLGHGRGGIGGTSLDVACWALGIASPKGAMDGSMVAPAYARGDIEAIATYNAADVRATAAVYRHACEHLLPYRNDW